MMTPWYKGFNGSITNSSHQHWTAEGVYVRNGDKVTVTELPPGKWTQDYKEYLDGLMEKGIIRSYVNRSTTETVNFELLGCPEGVDLKLTKSITTTNMHLFHPTKGIKKYDTPEEILIDFTKVRLEYYKARRLHWLKVIEERIQILENKNRFINHVVSGYIIVFMRNKNDLVKELGAKKFTHIDSLLDVKTYQYTSDHIHHLENEVTKLKIERNDLQNSTPSSLYKSDINKIIPKQ